MEIGDIFGITLDTNLKNGTREKNVHQLVLKMRRNEKNRT